MKILLCVFLVLLVVSVAASLLTPAAAAAAATPRAPSERDEQVVYVVVAGELGSPTFTRIEVFSFHAAAEQRRREFVETYGGAHVTLASRIVGEQENGR